jgi:hypothetical protein
MNEIVIKETETFKQFDILLDEKVIGSAEIKYPDMTLNNFFIYPEYRNKGYGQKDTRLWQKELHPAGHRYGNYHLGLHPDEWPRLYRDTLRTGYLQCASHQGGSCRMLLRIHLHDLRHFVQTQV